MENSQVALCYSLLVDEPIQFRSGIIGEEEQNKDLIASFPCLNNLLPIGTRFNLPKQLGLGTEMHPNDTSLDAEDKKRTHSVDSDLCLPEDIGTSIDPDAKDRRAADFTFHEENSIHSPILKRIVEQIPTPKFELVPINIVEDWMLRQGSDSNIIWQTGLQNQGNTCFLNSILQCLVHLYPFRRSLQWWADKTKAKISVNSADKAFQSFSVSRELCILTKQLTESNKGSLPPSAFVRHLRSVCRTMHLGNQEDSHEYLLGLLQGLEKEQVGSKTLDSGSLQTTVVRRLFGGWMQSRVRFRDGVSDTYESSTVLSLEVVGHTLQECLTHYTREEFLGHNVYKTVKGNMVSATRQFSFVFPPRILILHFKRFSGRGKINRSISFPDLFEMVPSSQRNSYVFSFPEEKSRMPSKTDQKLIHNVKYTLFAVNVHQGHGMTCGHYYSYCRGDSRQALWYCCNDSSVRVVSSNEVLKSPAYILFYIQDPPYICSSTSASKTISQTGQEFLLKHSSHHTECGELFRKTLDKSSARGSRITCPDLKTENNAHPSGSHIRKSIESEIDDSSAFAFASPSKVCTGEHVLENLKPGNMNSKGGNIDSTHAKKTKSVPFKMLAETHRNILLSRLNYQDQTISNNENLNAQTQNLYSLPPQERIGKESSDPEWDAALDLGKRRKRKGLKPFKRDFKRNIFQLQAEKLYFKREKHNTTRHS